MTELIPKCWICGEDDTPGEHKTKKSATGSCWRTTSAALSSHDRDEHYVIDLCDHVLGIAAGRQHRFAFLIGDPGRNGACRRLPVDAFYEPLALAVEYRERQHSEPVAFMDRRHTVSGCTRGEQRRRYDERRRIVLPQHGVRLIELDYSMFAHDGRKRLRRDRVADELVIRSRFAELIPVSGDHAMLPA